MTTILSTMEKQVTIQQAVENLGLVGNAKIEADFQLAGQKPEQYIGHSTVSEMIIMGITPEEFLDQHSTTQFDLARIYHNFREICHDFSDPLEIDGKSMALEFCSKVLYEIGPSSRAVKRGQGDKAWILKFPYKIEGRLVINTALILTFKNSEYRDYFNNGKLILTIKQAGLLAMDTLTKLIPIALGFPNPIYLLTPLAGAVFSKDSIDDIAQLSNQPVANILITVNCSCQSGGQYLIWSEVAVAAVAVITATKNLKSKEMRNQIIVKTIKQYRNANKEWTEEIFILYSRFATGGIPDIMNPDKLIDLYDSIQTSKLESLRILKSAAMPTKFYKPPKMATPVSETSDQEEPPTPPVTPRPVTPSGSKRSHSKLLSEDDYNKIYDAIPEEGYYDTEERKVITVDDLKMIRNVNLAMFVKKMNHL